VKDDSQQALTPKLRFPEFRHAPRWEATPLAEVCDLYQPVTISSSALVEDGKYCVYGANGIIGKYDHFNHEFGEVIITCRGATCGEVHFTKAKSWITGNAMVVSPKTSDVSKFFLHRFFLASDLSSVISGSAQPQITRQGFARFPLFFPALPEQNKIADCLSSLDELIAVHSRKLDALKAQRKGVMRALFPREGETLPRLRFREFQDAREWEMKSIGQLGEVVTGSTPTTALPEYYGGYRLFVSPADISDERFIDKTKTTLTDLGFRETRPIKANSILFVCIGSTIGKVAQNRHECATNQQINSVVPNLNNSDGFIYYALSGMADKIANLAGKQAVPIVNKSLFSCVELAVPKLPEQTRIADCLSSLDETIFAQTQKLDALKTHKKGLMQQLFPFTARG
jgi:type I restriction enzyme, S subunit